MFRALADLFRPYSAFADVGNWRADRSSAVYATLRGIATSLEFTEIVTEVVESNYLATEFVAVNQVVFCDPPQVSMREKIY